MAKEFTEENWETEVLKSEKPVLVDFWAEWCGPCRLMGPVIDKMAEELPEFSIGKLNIDKNPNKPTEVGIASIPTFLIFKNGEVTKRMSGIIKREVLEEALRS